MESRKRHRNRNLLLQITTSLRLPPFPSSTHVRTHVCMCMRVCVYTMRIYVSIFVHTRSLAILGELSGTWERGWRGTRKFTTSVAIFHGGGGGRLPCNWWCTFKQAERARARTRRLFLSKSAGYRTRVRPRYQAINTRLTTLPPRHQTGRKNTQPFRQSRRSRGRE